MYSPILEELALWNFLRRKWSLTRLKIGCLLWKPRVCFHFLLRNLFQRICKIPWWLWNISLALSSYCLFLLRKELYCNRTLRGICITHTRLFGNCPNIRLCIAWTRGSSLYKSINMDVCLSCLNHTKYWNILWAKRQSLLNVKSVGVHYDPCAFNVLPLLK